jgi:protein-S-isoprenylcysteine O-methyltransferase Ste14
MGDANRASRIATTIASGIVVPGGILVAIPAVVLTYREAPFPRFDALAAFGVVAALAGVVLLVACSRRFVVHGGGTPNPMAPPEFLVAGGAYRVVRNPIYVSFALVIAGEALIFRSMALALYLAVVLATCHAFVVLSEEPTLRRAFGASYDRYCARVPRWVPRIGVRRVE